MRFPGKTIGYIRTARWFKSISDQERSLAPLRCHNVWIEERQHANASLHLALMDCRSGDVLAMDTDAYFALKRSERREMFKKLLELGTGFYIVCTAINSNGPHGELVIEAMLKILDSLFLAHSQVVKLGLERARAAGRRSGRPRSLTSVSRELAQLMIERGASMQEAARVVGVGRNTLYDAGLRTKRKGRPKKDQP